MKQTFKQFLIETPLPDDWDDAVFDQRIPFAQRVKYARERAKSVGSGSSRIAFVIPYKGRNTVLKIAKNRKGMAQNYEEAVLLNDYYLGQLNLVIPLIDADTKDENNPTWLHTEFANKAKDSDFIRATGVNLWTLVSYAEQQSGRDRSRSLDFTGIDEESELVQNMVDFVGSYTHVPTGDLYRLANWGVYQGNPVIIDLGLTDTSLEFYKRKQ